jgi:hypothetical protein
MRLYGSSKQTVHLGNPPGLAVRQLTTVADNVAMAVRNFAASFAISSLFAGGELGLFADIQNLATLWQEESMTTASAVGDPVGYIVDQSGTGHHLVNATSGQKPLLRQDGSGYYYLEADGVDDKLVATFAEALGDCTLVFAGPDEITVRTITVGTTFDLHTGLCYGLLLINRPLTEAELGSIL